MADPVTFSAARGDIDAAISSALAFGIVDQVVSGQVVSVPQGRTLQSLKPLLDQFIETPERRVGVQPIAELPSLVAWTKRHQDSGSVLFCDTNREAPAIVSVIDYHVATPEGGGAVGGVDVLARWRKFGAVYNMPLDERWKAWRKIDGQAMGQAEFAAFLEDHALDLCPFAPTIAAASDTLLALPSDVQDFLNLTGGICGTPQDVIGLAKGLDVAVGQKVANAVKLQSGEGRIVFEQENQTSKDGVAVTVPAVFLVAVPVFALSKDLYRLPVRLRYRATPGGLVWLPTLWRADETLDQAIRDAAEKAASETGLPLFYGASPFRGQSQ